MKLGRVYGLCAASYRSSDLGDEDLRPVASGLPDLIVHSIRLALQLSRALHRKWPSQEAPA
eukprot:scaffold320825_cov17-Tisochrysis_lutea.AAC.1